MSKKSLHSDVEIPQLWENLQVNKTELVNSLISFAKATFVIFTWQLEITKLTDTHLLVWFIITW